MTAARLLTLARALVGTVTRETGIALLALADVLDPPPVSPRVRAERELIDANPVPDVIPDWMVSEP